MQIALRIQLEAMLTIQPRKTTREMAASILELLENHKMLPPAYEVLEPVNTINLCGEQLYRKKQVNEWENEEPNEETTL